MSDRELKSRCRIIQQLLDEPNFFVELCNKANNDIEEVIKLLSKIINYALNTNGETINLEDVRTVENTEVCIYPTNTHYYSISKTEMLQSFTSHFSPFLFPHSLSLLFSFFVPSLLVMPVC